MIKNIFIIAIVCFITVGCKFNSSMLNQESDKADGEKVANTLFSLLSDDKYGEAEKLFGEEFFTVASKEQLSSIFTKTNSVLGKFKANKLVDWRAEEMSGSVNKTDYSFTYEVEYEKDKATVNFLLLKKDDGPVKIIGYHVNSPAFLK